jgi:hypothetical protein
VILGGVERAEGAVPLAVEQADAVAVEDVEDLRAGARARTRGRRRGWGRLRRDRRQRRAAEELHRPVCPDLSRRCEADLRPERKVEVLGCVFQARWDRLPRFSLSQPRSPEVDRYHRRTCRDGARIVVVVCSEVWASGPGC